MSIVHLRLAALALATVGLAVPSCPADGATASPSSVKQASAKQASAKHAKRPRMSTDVPSSLTVPDTLDTRIGTLLFRDGVPDEASAQKVYDNLDFQRATLAYLNTQQAASLAAMRKGMLGAGASDHAGLLFGDLLDARSLFLTANTDTVYAMAWLDLKEGAMVLEAPPGVLGLADDAWFHYITDIGIAGPDRGKGGKYLFLPPGYAGEVPAGYVVTRPRTYGVWVVLRGFLDNGNPRSAAANMRKMRMYRLEKAAKPPPFHFVNVSGKAFNTIQAGDAGFFEQVNEVVQSEPADATDAETLGLLASIGIEKGKTFAPDARMRGLLTEAAHVGNATLRTLTYRSRDEHDRIYPDGTWTNSLAASNYLFERQGARLLDPRSQFFFMATGITPAMDLKEPGAGSQYATTFLDAQHQPLDGGKSYRLHLPAGIPAAKFWSVVVYDTQTRSELQTDQRLPGIGSQRQGLVTNKDGSVDILFGPTAPAAKKGVNWVQTLSGKGWFVILRLYGPQAAWFDRSWRPGELEPSG